MTAERSDLRRVLAFISALSIAFGAGMMALTLLRDGAAGGGAVAASGRSVLSVRRVPQVLRRSIGAQRLQARVDQVFAAPEVASAVASSCLLIDGDGALVDAWRPDARVIPASTLKLLTATGALSTMRPDSTLRTAVRATAAPSGGTLNGDLWLVGGGDPLLESAAYTATRKHPANTATSLDRLADDVVAAGITRVTGRVVGDDRLFDSVRVVPTWKRSYVSDGEVGPLGGLIVDDNFSVVDAKGRRRASSNVPVDAAAAFQRLLEERGVKVAGAAASADGAGPAASEAPVEVAAIESIPLSGLVAEMLRESDNTTAEALLKLVGIASGGDGSTASGASAVRRSLRLGGARTAQIASLHMVDGSGLDRSDRVSCRLQLQSVRDQPKDSPLLEGLAVMGKTGTLRERLRGTPAAGNVRAKTGTLNGVSALVGVGTGADGQRVTFALIWNGLRSTASGVAGGDAIAQAIVAFPEAPDAATLAP